MNFPNSTDVDGLVERVESDPGSVDIRDVDLEPFLTASDRSTRMSVLTVLSTVAATAAERTPEERATVVEQLAAALDDPIGDHRKIAVDSLQEVARTDPEAVGGVVPELLDCLDDDFGLVVSKALEVLAETVEEWPPEVEVGTNRLASFMESDLPNVRAGAGELLVALAGADPGSVDELFPNVVAALLEPYEIGDAPRGLSDPSRAERTDYLQTEERRRWMAENEKVRSALARAMELLARHDVDAVSADPELLREFLSDSNVQVRLSTLRLWTALAESDPDRLADDPELLQDLVSDALSLLVGDRLADVRVEAAVVVATILERVSPDHGDELKPYADELRDNLTHRDPQVRASTAGLLTYAVECDMLSRDGETERVLGSLLADDSLLVRFNAASALGYLYDDDETIALSECVSGVEDPAVEELVATAKALRTGRSTDDAGSP